MSGYSAAAADRAVSFFNRILVHTKGRWASVPFDLRPWQEHQIIRPLFGTLREDGRRQYRTGFVAIPRKNGKSEIAAGIALYLLIADGEEGAEVYGAAADRDQASIVFNVAAEMVRRSPALSKRCKVIDSQKRIIVPKTGSFYRAIPADAAGSHGFNAHGIVFDELHTQPNRELWDVLTTSVGAREQPLVFGITTAGYDRESVCWEVWEYARQVAAGTIDDPSFFAYLQAAPEEADWTDEGIWRSCNPALGDFRGIDEMRDMFRRAQQTPSLQNTFRRLYLNQWTQQADRWIDLSLWDANAGTVIEDRLAGRTCYGGLDLASVSDMAAWVLAFPDPEDPEAIDVIARFFCPESRLTDPANKYRAQYQTWQRQGLLTVTPGDATDFAFIKQRILADAQRFRLIELNVDRLFSAHQLAGELANEGLTVIGMGQGYLSMAAPMAELHRRLLLKKVHHGGNAILRWMADGVSVKQDPAGNLKPDKATSQVKIDGIVSLVMALDRVMRREGPSVYEGRGLLVL